MPLWTPLCVQLDLKYKHCHFNATASGSVIAKPVVEGSLAVGGGGFVAGAEVGYDTATKATTKYNFGLAYSEKDYSASLLL